MAETTYWGTRAPVWLRVLLGLLILPVVWLVTFLALVPPLGSAVPEIVLRVGAAVAAGALSGLIVRKASKRRAAGVGVLTVLAYGLVFAAAIPSYQASKPDRPQAEVPGAPGSGPGEASLPTFPWPPPKASASYVLPGSLLEGFETVGDASDAILAALEANGYVERSFFRTEDGGVALVTRLERITSDGYSYPSSGRWPGKGQAYDSQEGLFQFLRGLFYVDPGHYRVIVFVLQDLPFSQSPETASADEAKAWLTGGANHLPAAIAARDFGDARGTVLIYEFASDGRDVEVIDSALTGKDHLENAGVLAEFDSLP